MAGLYCEQLMPLIAGFVDDVRGRHAPKLVIDGKETEFNTVSKGKYQVEQIITEGKGKMPAYGKSLKPDEIKAMVAYVRGLAK